ncbi:hypothetical protein ACFWVF_18530 [Streptomyces sp. NPDC058659]|uniref:hypothetical protein n=1 Tax=unclassified Streptomyces TaxID=2593676 RepID=UPI003645F89E
MPAPARAPGSPVVEAAEADARALTDAGVERAAALALVHEDDEDDEDDETDIRAGLSADRSAPAYGAPYGTGAAARGQDRRLAPERVLGPGDRMIVAATRRGLAELLGRGGATDHRTAETHASDNPA